MLRVPAGRQRALLSLLAVRAPHPVSAEVAAEALWPGASPAEAPRSSAGDGLAPAALARAGRAPRGDGGSGYRLAVADDAIDARRFEALLVRRAGRRAAGDAAAARRCSTRRSRCGGARRSADVAFEVSRRGRSRGWRSCAWSRSRSGSTRGLATGEHALVVAELEQLAAEHPSRERLVGLLMLALYRCGRQADALEAYTRAQPPRRGARARTVGGAAARCRRRSCGRIRRSTAERRWRARLPEGVVTMLFTDIEGSTRMAQRARGLGVAGGAGRSTTSSCRRGRRCGRSCRRQPKATRCSRTSLTRAPRSRPRRPPRRRCARTGGRSPVGELRVRMGIQRAWSPVGAGYGGLEVHLTARMAAAAHGGQVVVSAAARALLAPADELADLGEHRLKDFPAPERLWLLLHDERGPGDFPPLRTEPVRPTNLPADARRLVGREAEIEALWDMLTGTERLVTILGFGGTGKTRLALAAPRRACCRRSRAGVWLVSLAGVREPTRWSRRSRRRSASPRTAVRARRVARRLRARPTLLVLDNFEQIVEAAATVAGLLDQAPECRALVTSQLPLRIGHERLLRLAPLPERPRCGCSPSARARRRPTSTRRPAGGGRRRSATGSTACRSRSSWRPRASRRSRPASCSPASTVHSAARPRPARPGRAPPQPARRAGMDLRAARARRADAARAAGGVRRTCAARRRRGRRRSRTAITGPSTRSTRSAA